MPLTVTVNGETRRTSADTLAALVRELELAPEKVAVERNGEIVPRSTLGEAPLAEGDVLEIVHFVGGGDHHRPLRLREREDRRGRKPLSQPSPAGGEG